MPAKQVTKNTSLNVTKAREFYFDDKNFENYNDGYTRQLLTLIRTAINENNIDKIELYDMIIGDHIRRGITINEGIVYIPKK